MRHCGRNSPSCGALTGTLEPTERKVVGPQGWWNRSRFRAADSTRPDLPEAAHFGRPPENEKLTRSSEIVYPALDGPCLSHLRGRTLRRLQTLLEFGASRAPPGVRAHRSGPRRHLPPRLRLALLIPGWLYIVAARCVSVYVRVIRAGIREADVNPATTSAPYHHGDNRGGGRA